MTCAPMTPTQATANFARVQAVTRKHHGLVQFIATILETAEIPAEEAEILLLHMAGMSAGDRQQPMSSEWLGAVSSAWAFAAEHGEG